MPNSESKIRSQESGILSFFFTNATDACVIFNIFALPRCVLHFVASLLHKMQIDAGPTYEWCLWNEASVPQWELPLSEKDTDYRRRRLSVYESFCQLSGCLGNLSYSWRFCFWTWGERIQACMFYEVPDLNHNSFHAAPEVGWTRVVFCFPQNPCLFIKGKLLHCNLRLAKVITFEPLSFHFYILASCNCSENDQHAQVVLPPAVVRFLFMLHRPFAHIMYTETDIIPMHVSA